MTLPIDVTTATSREDHVDHHNALHARYNEGPGAGGGVFIDLSASPYNVSEAGGATANRDAIKQASIDAEAAGGGTLVLPVGTILITQEPDEPFCIALHTNVSIIGHGRGATIVKVADGTAASFTRVFATPSIPVQNVRLAHFTIDGNKANRPADPAEQSHTIIWAGRNPGDPDEPTDYSHYLIVEDMELCRCDGDGVAMADFSGHVWVRGCDIHDNDRAGVSLLAGASMITDVWIEDNDIRGGENGVGMEPNDTTGGVDRIYVHRNTLAKWFPTVGHVNYSSNGPRALSNAPDDEDSTGPGTFWCQNIQWVGNIMFGPLVTNGCKNVLVADNTIYSQSTEIGAIHMGWHNKNITVRDNNIHQLNHDDGSIYNTGIMVFSSDNEGVYQPKHIRIENNRVTLYKATQTGIYSEGAYSIEIRGNIVTWADGAPIGSNGPGISVRTPYKVSESAVIQDNRVVNPRGRGIYLSAVGTQADLNYWTHTLLIDRNVILDNQTVSTMTTGIDIVNQAAMLGPSCIFRNSDNIVNSVAGSSFAPGDAAHTVTSTGIVLGSIFAVQSAAHAHSTATSIGTLAADLITGNLLNLNAQSNETSQVWLNSENTIVTRVTSQAYDSAASIQMEAIAVAGAMGVEYNTTVTGLTALTSYTFSAWIKAATAARQTRCTIRWFDNIGSALSDSAGTLITDATTGWTQIFVTDIAPSGTTQANLRIYVVSPAAGEIHWTDRHCLRTDTGLPT